MKKLIIAIGIIAAILAILISFKAKGEIKIIGRTFNLQIFDSFKNAPQSKKPAPAAFFL